jgi:hypothetical protein
MTGQLMRAVDRRPGAESEEGAGSATSLARLVESPWKHRQVEERPPDPDPPGPRPRGARPPTERPKGRNPRNAVNELTATRGQDERGQRS